MVCSKSVSSYCSEYTFIETSLRHLKIKKNKINKKVVVHEYILILRVIPSLLK